MRDSRLRPTLAPQTYRRVDRLTKLVGVFLVAVGLEVGGYTVAGVALGAAGTTLALSTVFVDRTTDSTTSTTDE